VNSPLPAPLSATRVGPDGLIEKVRTNLILQSETFDNASWSKITATVTANTTTAPNGTTTADTFDSTGSFAFLSQQPTIASGSLATYSVYIKNIDAPYVNLQVRSTITAGLARFDFTGATLTGSTLTTGISASFTDVGSGWYRCTLTCITSEVNQQFRVQLVSSGHSVFLWGAMAEVGDAMTDYIATTTAAVSVGPVANVPRLDYLGATCGPRLNLEPQRTNLMLNSERIGSWLLLDASATSNTAVSPSGYADADTATATGNAPHFIYQNLAFTSGTAYTLSVFAKANTSDYIQLVLAGQFSATNYANFDLSNGTITASAFVTAKIEDYGNGWYRCSVSATAPSSATNSQIVYLINSPTAPRAQSFNASGESVYLWGGQFEAGAYATSYIPTLGAAVTRLADSASKTGISSLIGQTEGTILLDLVGGSDNVNVAFRASDGTNNNRVQFEWSGSASANYIVSSGGSIQAIIIGIYCSQGTRHKIALAYKQNDFVIYLNGSQVGSDTSGAVPTSLTQIEFSEGAASPYTGTVNQALVFKTRLTNAQLAELTTL
jgi:hypothetical protein